MNEESTITPRTPTAMRIHPATTHDQKIRRFPTDGIGGRSFMAAAQRSATPIWSASRRGGSARSTERGSRARCPARSRSLRGRSGCRDHARGNGSMWTRGTDRIAGGTRRPPPRPSQRPPYRAGRASEHRAIERRRSTLRRTRSGAWLRAGAGRVVPPATTPAHARRHPRRGAATQDRARSRGRLLDEPSC